MSKLLVALLPTLMVLLLSGCSHHRTSYNSDNNSPGNNASSPSNKLVYGPLIVPEGGEVVEDSSTNDADLTVTQELAMSLIEDALDLVPNQVRYDIVEANPEGMVFPAENPAKLSVLPREYREFGTLAIMVINALYPKTITPVIPAAVWYERQIITHDNESAAISAAVTEISLSNNPPRDAYNNALSLIVNLMLPNTPPVISGTSSDASAASVDVSKKSTLKVKKHTPKKIKKTASAGSALSPPISTPARITPITGPRDGVYLRDDEGHLYLFEEA